MPVWSHLISSLFRPVPVSHLKTLEDFVNQWVPPSRKKKRANPAPKTGADLATLEDLVHQWVPPSWKRKRVNPVLVNAIPNSTMAETDSSKTCEVYVVETAPKTAADSSGKTDYNNTDNSKVDVRANGYREMEDGDEVDSAEETDDREETDEIFWFGREDFLCLGEILSWLWGNKNGMQLNLHHGSLMQIKLYAQVYSTWDG